MGQERLLGDPFPNTQCEVSMSVFMEMSKLIPPIYHGSFPQKRTKSNTLIWYIYLHVG